MVLYATAKHLSSAAFLELGQPEPPAIYPVQVSVVDVGLSGAAVNVIRQPG